MLFFIYFLEVYVDNLETEIWTPFLCRDASEDASFPRGLKENQGGLRSGCTSEPG